MTISMYQASVPVFLQMLKGLSNNLDKTVSHLTAKKMDPAAFLNARLYPDMYPLVKQVQLSTDFAKGAGARLAGVENPKFADTETSFDELKARIERAVAFLNSLKPAQIDGSEGRNISLTMGGKTVDLKGQHYLLSVALPNFYFHVATAHAILRHNGVEIGKRDFLGQN
jgi:hypothetical protein